MVAGRPRKYSQEDIEREADLLDEWITKDDNIYFKRFSIERGYPAKYMIDWARENEKFGESYARAKDWQECKLLEGGLTRKYDGPTVKLGLYHVSHWRETPANESPTEPAIPPSAINNSQSLIYDPQSSMAT